MEQKEKISVIIPTYNRAHTIERSVQSVLDQTYYNIEVIVVDDGGNDNTEEIIKGIRDERVHFHSMQENGGAGRARNEGVKLASAELIAFHDSDDVWKPEKLERQMKYWQKHPEYAMIYSAYLCRLTDGTKLIMPNGENKREGNIFKELLLKNSIGTPTILTRKAYFWNAGGFAESYQSLEDWEFALRFASKYLIGYLDEITVDVCLSDQGVSSGAGAYYESRCRMIAAYRQEMVELGVFDLIVSDVFSRAEKGGVLDTVKKVLLALLQN